MAFSFDWGAEPRMMAGLGQSPRAIERKPGMPHSVEKVTVAGATIRLFRGSPRGEGATPLLFLHGAGGHTGWMAFLEELTARFDVLAPEHPGFGQSDAPVWLDEGGDVAFFYLDLLQALGLDRVHLVGTSLGGWIAAEL